jgi:Fe-S-cluster containining protein
MKEHH